MDPGRTGIFTDFDGTLSPIVSDPDAAEPAAGVPRLLEELSRRYRLVAVISGRGAQDLSRRIGVSGPRYIGLYGAEEMLDSGLSQSPQAPRWREVARALAAEARTMIQDRKLTGCEVEYKDLAVSIHYRKTGSQDPPPAVLAWAQASGPPAGFHWGIGRKVVELRPRQVTKAGVFEDLFAGAGLHHAVVGGDDSADAEMMRRAAELVRGQAIRIGIRSAEEPPGLAESSDVRVESPAQMVTLLERLL